MGSRVKGVGVTGVAAGPLGSMLVRGWQARVIGSQGRVFGSQGGQAGRGQCGFLPE